MARKLNKNLVGGLTLSGMVLLAVVGFVLLQSLPGQDPKVYEAEAEKLEEDGEFNRAMQMYWRAYRKDPDQSPRYMVMAARCALEDGSIGDARGFLAKALVRDSELNSALELTTKMEFEFAELFRGSSQWNLVRERANKLLEVDDQSPLAHHALGMAHWNLREDSGYKVEADKHLNRALELDPTNVDIVEDTIKHLWASAQDHERNRRKAEAQELWDAAAAILGSAIDKCRNLADEQALSKLKQLEALHMVLIGSIEEGLANLVELANARTDDADCYLLLTSMYLGRPPFNLPLDLAKAEEFASGAVEVGPKNGEGHWLLGQINGWQGEPDKEADCYRRGLEEIPYEEHFRAFRNNRHRVNFITELFMREIRSAAAARDASDDDPAGAAMAAAETWVEKLKEHLHEESLYVRFLNAHLLNARGEYVAATSEAEAANRMAGAAKHSGLHQLLTELYMRREEWGAARNVLEAGLRLNPNSVRLRLRLGQVFLRLRQPTKALRTLKPTNAAALRESLDANEMAAQLRLEAYSQLGQFDQARRETQRLAQDNPETELRRAEILLAEGRSDEAEQKVKAVLASDPKSKAAIRLVLRIYALTDRLEEARSMVKELRERNPDERLYQSYELMLMEEDGSATREDMQEEFLAGIEDEFVRALSLSDFYRRKERPEEAAKLLDQAEQMRPDSPAVIHRQFRSALVAKDWDRAEKYAVRDGELNLDGTEGSIARGRLLMLRGELAKAVETMKAGLNKYPSYSQGWTHLATAYLVLGRLSEAKSVLQGKALEVDPTNGWAHRILAEIAVREADEEAEWAHLEAASKYLPNDPWIKRRHQIMEEKKNPREGIASREKTRREDPENVENLVFLARLYALPEVGDYDTAAEVYDQALELYDNKLELAREIAGFFGREEVNRPSEGEALLKKLLVDEEDKAKKSLAAIYLGQFYETQDALATADRHFRLAVSLDPSPNALVSAAEFYTRINKSVLALEYYERVLKHGEDDPNLTKSVRSRIIGLLLSRLDLEEARNRIGGYRRAYPDDPQGLVFEGAYHRLGGDIGESKKAFDGYLEKHPDSALALWQRGQLNILMGRWEAAVNDLQKAKVFRPLGFGYQHRISLADALVEAGRSQEAVSELRSILDENTDVASVAEALVDIYQRINPPRPTEAEDLIYTYMRRYPKDIRWPMLLGALGERSRDWNKAIQGYEAAAEAGRYRGRAVPALFKAYKAAGRPNDIIRFVDERLSTRLLETMPDVLSSLAWAYSQMGETEKCFEAYDRALAAAEGDFRVYTGVVLEVAAALGKEVVLARTKSQVEADPENVHQLQSLVHLLFMNEQYQEAVGICDQIASLAVRDTDNVFASLAKGMLLASLNRHAEAKANYEDVLELDPRHSVALNNLAFLLAEELDNAAEALPYAEQANRVKPNDPDILDTLGWILAENDRLSEAAGMLLRAIELDRNHVAAACHLGIVHMRRGEFVEARRRLNSAKALAESREGDSRHLPTINQALDELEKADD